MQKLMPQKYQQNGILGCTLHPNKIEKKHELKKYKWQKPHQPNLTGTDKAYYPNKNENAIKKKYKSWKD